MTEPSIKPTAMRVSVSFRQRQEVETALLGTYALEILTHVGWPCRSSFSKFQTLITGLTPISSSCKHVTNNEITT